MCIAKPQHFHFWKSDSSWSTVEKCPGVWPATKNELNTHLMVRRIARASDYAYAVQYLRDAIGVTEVDGDPSWSFDREEPIVTMDIVEDHTRGRWESHSRAPVMCSEEDKRAIIETEKQKKAFFAQPRGQSGRRPHRDWRQPSDGA